MSGEAEFVTEPYLEQTVLHIQLEQAEDRKRIFYLENKVDDLLETITQLKTNPPVIMIEDGLKETQEGKANRLYSELKTKGHMKNADIMSLFKLDHYAQATRIMRKTEEMFDDVRIEKTLGKKHRVITLVKNKCIKQSV